MAECKIIASIHLGGLEWIKLSKPMETELPNLQIKSLRLSSSSNQELQVELKVEATSKSEAKELARYKLNQIVDILSFKNDVAIERVEIHKMLLWDEKDIPRGEALEVLQCDLRVARLEELDPSVIESYIKALADYSTEVIELLFMYREAIGQESSSLKYILLHRLLEKAKGGGLQEWLKKEDSHVPVVEERGRKISKYTHLRDHIHPKQAQFPLAEIEQYLPGLQRLAKKAITERIEQDKTFNL